MVILVRACVIQFYKKKQPVAIKSKKNLTLVLLKHKRINNELVEIYFPEWSNFG